MSESESISLDSRDSISVYPLESSKNENSFESIEFPNSFYASDEVNKAEIEEPQKKPSFWRQYWDRIRPTYITQHLDYKSFKVAFRTWVQVWVSVVLIIIPRSVRWFGNGAYILQIVGFICVAGGTSIVINIQGSLICAFYTLAAWMTSIIAMKITHAIRGYPSKQDMIEIIVQGGDCLMPAQSREFAACISGQIFTGRFLQTKTTVIYIFAIMISLILSGLTQKYYRLIRLGYLMSVITLLITCCYGVFFPYFDPYAVGLTVIKPMGVGLLIKAVVAIVIFPVTSSYQYYGSCIKSFQGLIQASENNMRFLKSFQPSASNFSNYSHFKKDVTATKPSIEAAEFFASTMRWEIAYSRFDLGDTGEFRSLLKHLVSVSSGYDYFYAMLQERKQAAANDFGDLRRRGSAGSRISIHHSQFGDLKVLSSIHDNYKKVGEYENRRRMRLLKARISNIESVNRVTLKDLDYIASFIRHNFMEIIEANHSALKSIVQWLIDANEFRTYTKFIPGATKKNQQKQIENNKKLLADKSSLQKSLAILKDSKHLESIFKEVTLGEEAFLTLISQTSLFLYFTKCYTEHNLKFINLFLLIDEKRPNPTIITYFTRTNFEKAGTYYDNEYPTDAIEADFNYEANKRNPDSLPPNKWYNFAGSKFVRFYKLLYNGHVWFWIRSAVLVCVAATPFFCRTTAGWYYKWRQIWLVIMAALSTSETTGHTIYVFGAKLCFTFFGCLLGGIAWYISTGSGHGNPYGFGAVNAVVILFLSYYRHFSVHLSLIPQILFAVTTSLVLGTSWVDERFNTNPNLGGGWKVALTRLVGVIIGLLLGLLAPLFPRPKTSKTELRKILSRSIYQIGNFHCGIAHFGYSRFENDSIHIRHRHDKLIGSFRKLFHDKSSIAELVIALKHEIPLSGEWPQEHYTRLQSCAADITQLQYILYTIFDDIENTEQIPVMFRRLGWSNPEFTANLFSTIHMVSDSLKTKNPLPKITEATLSVKHMDLLMGQWGIGSFSLNERFYEDELKEDLKQKDESVIHQLDFLKFFSHDGQLSIVALLLIHIIYKRLDEIMIVVKELVGENFLVEDSIFDDDLLFNKRHFD